MKKLILLLALAFVMCGCVQPVGETRAGEIMSVPIEKGATRLTITKDYIIVETLDITTFISHIGNVIKL